MCRNVKALFASISWDVCPWILYRTYLGESSSWNMIGFLLIHLDCIHHKYREVRISAQNWNFQINEFRTLTIVLGLKCKAASTQRAGGGQSINRRWCTMYMRPRGGHWTQFNLATAKTDWPIGPREAVQSRNRPLVTNPSSSSGHLNVLVAITGALVLDVCFRFRS